jgi:hypothetical protein
MLGHVMGAPVEETAVQFVGSGAVMVTAVVLLGRAKFGRLLIRLRRR